MQSRVQLDEWIGKGVKDHRSSQAASDLTLTTRLEAAPLGKVKDPWVCVDGQR